MTLGEAGVLMLYIGVFLTVLCVLGALMGSRRADQFERRVHSDHEKAARGWGLDEEIDGARLHTAPRPAGNRGTTPGG